MGLGPGALSPAFGSNVAAVAAGGLAALALKTDGTVVGWDMLVGSSRRMRRTPLPSPWATDGMVEEADNSSPSKPMEPWSRGATTTGARPSRPRA